MSGPVFTMALRRRRTAALLSGSAMVVVILIVGALFPSLGDTIGKLELPEGVAELLGGADYGTLTGWLQTEIGSVYGPLVLAAAGITGVSTLLAGEEEAGILALLLAHPVSRRALLLAKAAGVAVTVLAIAAMTLIGLVAGVAIAGGGVAIGKLAALTLHLAMFGLASGAVALAVAAGTGRRAVANGAAAGVAVLGYLINGFAPLVAGIEWTKYLSPFFYYASGEPLSNGADVADLAVLAALTVALTALAVVLLNRRDLRG